MKKDFLLSLRTGEELDITTYGLPNENNPAIICVHGFKGFKDWGFWHYTGEILTSKNYFVITFNFSYNGVSIGKEEFDEPEKFAENTYSREVNELNELIDATAGGFFEGVKFNSIGLLGHSRGGADAIIAASENSKVNALVTWASIAELDRYSDRQKSEWRQKGYLEVINSRTKQVMRMNLTLLEDIDSNADGRLNIKKAVSSLNIPYLIIHGDQDLAVNVHEAKLLYEYSNKKETEIQLVKAAGHTFDIKHPFEGSNDKFDKVIGLTVNFFMHNLIRQ